MLSELTKIYIYIFFIKGECNLTTSDFLWIPYRLNRPNTPVKNLHTCIKLEINLKLTPKIGLAVFMEIYCTSSH